MISDKNLTRMAFLASLFAGGLAVSILCSQPARGSENTSADTPVQRHKVSPYHQASVTQGAITYYQSMWGIDKMSLQRTASDNLIRFTYRISDPERARVLNDKASTPLLFNPRTQAVLHIPVMEKVGPLRQTFAPEAGKEYWMAFSNKGNLVREGDRVNVIIGSFHADGLLVE